MAKIDVSNIAGYEAMSAEEKLNAVLGLEMDDGAAEIARLKDLVSKANSEAASWKKKHNEQLSEEERKNSETADTLQQLQDELATLRKEKAVSGYTANLLEVGFAPDEAGKAAKVLADGNLDAFWGHMKTYKAQLEKNIRAELQRRNPDPGSSGGNEQVMTKEKYAKLNNVQKMEFMRDHPDDYLAMKKS